VRVSARHFHAHSEGPGGALLVSAASGAPVGNPDTSNNTFRNNDVNLLDASNAMP
jgi:hypothetical protein